MLGNLLVGFAGAIPVPVHVRLEAVNEAPKRLVVFPLSPHLELRLDLHPLDLHGAGRHNPR